MINVLKRKLVDLFFCLRKGVLSLCLLFPLSDLFAQDYSQVLLDSLLAIDLPLVVVETENGQEPSCDLVMAPPGCAGASVINNNYENGQLWIIHRGDTLYNSGTYKENRSGMSIKIRGNMSSYRDVTRASYKLKLQRKAGLFDKETGSLDNEWYGDDFILINYTSSNDFRNHVGRHIAKVVGFSWEPASRFVNVVLNGHYKGLYILSEPVDRREDHVDVSVDGFILEDDAYWWNADGYVIHTPKLALPMAYTFKYPDDKDISEGYVESVKKYLVEVENAIYGGQDLSGLIDLRSFVNWLLAHDILGTWDALGANIFLFRKDWSPQSLLQMGPLWDFDSAFNVENVWCTMHNRSDGAFYYNELLKREDFVEMYQKRWEEVGASLYDEAMRVADSLLVNHGEAINASRALAAEVWGVETYRSAEENHAQVDAWFRQRIPWMENAVKKIRFPSSVHIYDMKGALVDVKEVLNDSDDDMLTDYIRQVYILRFMDQYGKLLRVEKRMDLREEEE